MYKELDDKELTERCREKDGSAAEELYNRYAARVYTLCRRYSRDSNEAKDIMQDTFIQVLERISTFNYNGKGSLYAWIRRIAINRAINQLKRQRWRMVSLNWNLQEDYGQDPSEEDVNQIPEEKLLELISGLSKVKRTVFNLYCIDGYTHKDIAKMLGISDKGSAGVLAKARRQLKEEIRKYLIDNE